MSKRVLNSNQFWHGTTADLHEDGGFVEAASSLPEEVRSLPRSSGVTYRNPHGEEQQGSAGDYAWLTRNRESAENWAWAAAENRPEHPNMYLYQVEPPSPHDVESMGDVVDATTDDEYVAPYARVVAKHHLGKNPYYKGEGDLV